MSNKKKTITIKSVQPRLPTKVVGEFYENKPNKRRPRRRNRRTARRNVSRPQVALSDCVVDYAHALVDPFSYSGPLPCIPDMLVIPSNKIKCVTTGTLQTGTNAGVGYVLYNPFAAVWNNAAGAGASTDVPVLYTTSTYDPGADSIVYTVAGGIVTTTGVLTANSNSPYARNGQHEYRLVAAGIKVQYTGNELYKQGTIHSYREPDNNTNSGTTASQMMADNYTRRQPVSRGEQFVYYTPSNTFYTSYHPDSALQPTTTGSHLFALAILITGGSVGNPQSWMWECVSYYELIGRGLPLSPSHSDPTGYGSVQAALPSKAPKGAPGGLFQAVIAGAAEAVKNNISHVIESSVMPKLTNVATGAGAYMANRAMALI